MSHKRQSPAHDGARQQFEGHVPNSAHKPAVTQAVSSDPFRLGGGYDEVFERTLTDVISAAMAEASTLPGGALYIRPHESVRALSTAMIGFLALMPDAPRSGPELHEMIGDIAKTLSEMATTTSVQPEVQNFRQRLRYV